MAAHVDEMLMKSIKATEHSVHLDEMFSILRKYKMMLNLTKCAFVVLLENFLYLR